MADTELGICAYLTGDNGNDSSSGGLNKTSYSNVSLVDYMVTVLPSNVTSPRQQPAPSSGVKWYQVVIPVVCLIGIVGNLLNLVVLTRRRMLSSMQRLERCATYGLAALAMSDMMFCIVVIPTVFIITERHLDLAQNVRWFIFSLYYRVYGIAFINLMLMVSNWLTVVIAINRFLVVMYPIHARHILSSCKTLASIVLVVVCSTIISLPYFLHLRVSACESRDGALTLQELQEGYASLSHNLRIYMRWIWPILAVFIPLLILAFCNACLIRELNSAALYRRSSCRRGKVKDTSHKVTLTLVIIVLMLFLLVSPSEILKYINPYKSWGQVGHTVAWACNALQATNFALNFFLYCVVNPNFRRTITDTFLHSCQSQSHSSLDDNSQSANGQQLDGATVQSTLLCEQDSQGRLTSRQQILAHTECHSTLTAL